MTDRSVPLTLDQEYRFRLTRADVEALENALGVGYTHFTRSGILGSLTALERFLWRGLYKEDGSGKLVHVFPMTDAGKEEAGDLLWAWLIAGGDDSKLIDQIIDGFCLVNICRKKAPGEPEEKDDGKDKNEPKNLPT